jgi:hypothetical protein
LRIKRNLNVSTSELLYHLIKISNAEIDHPQLLNTSEIIRILGKGREEPTTPIREIRRSSQKGASDGRPSRQSWTGI